MAAKKKKKPAVKSKALRDFAASLPGAEEAHPWGELVMKVKKKVFVFFGRAPDWEGMSVKLPKSKRDALAHPRSEPTGYGLGKSGWVSVYFDCGASEETLSAWIEESYRAIAPKKLVEELDAR
jgi:predicted DNA-binding protein (MmcQ/YjbR family)